MDRASVFSVLVVASIFLFNIWRIFNNLWFKPKKIEKFLKDQGLKGTPYKFLYGDLKEMAQMASEVKSKPMSLTHDIVPRVSPFFHKSITAFGKTCFTWMGTKPIIHVSEPSMVREVLANYNKFQKPRGGNPLAKLLARGLLDVEGEQWVKHRKIINPAFHMEKLKHMVPAFYVCCGEMIDKWGKIMGTKSSCEVDVWPYLLTYSSDVISRTSFGSSFEEGRTIFELQRELTELTVKVVHSVYIPGSRFLPTQNNKRMKDIDRQVRDSIKSIINKRIVAMKEGEARSNDLLGILLESNYQEIKQNGNSHDGLSMEEVVEECKLFYLGGQETSASMLVWTMVLLAQNNDWQTRAREEVMHVFKDKKPDMNGLSHLSVINIFNEVLRLYPPVALLRRLIHEETKLGNITLPTGTLIQVNTMFLNHDKDMWGDDVNEFNPERFLGVSKVTKGEVVHIPFGGGPRTCIGRNFVMLEAKMALAMILKHFSFVLSPSYSHAPHAVATVQPQCGVHLILHKL